MPENHSAHLVDALTLRELLTHLAEQQAAIHTHQRVMLKEIRQMSTEIQSQLDALTAAQEANSAMFKRVAAGIKTELDQLATVVSAGGFNPAQKAQLQRSIDAMATLTSAMEASVRDLASDDPAPEPAPEPDPAPEPEPPAG